ncbi:MAG: hypothetical protein U0903_21465 [Planctomycetales bacterium]
MSVGLAAELGNTCIALQSGCSRLHCRSPSHIPPADAPPRAGIQRSRATTVRRIQVPTKRGQLAHTPGVTVQALEQLQVGWNPVQQGWSFPERDAQGKVIGISARHENGDKNGPHGEQDGSDFSKGWDLREGPILPVEGGVRHRRLSLGLNLARDGPRISVVKGEDS